MEGRTWVTLSQGSRLGRFRAKHFPRFRNQEKQLPFLRSRCVSVATTSPGTAHISLFALTAGKLKTSWLGKAVHSIRHCLVSSSFSRSNSLLLTFSSHPPFFLMTLHLFSHGLILQMFTYWFSNTIWNRGAQTFIYFHVWHNLCICT